MKKFTPSSTTILLGALVVASTWSCGGNSESHSTGSGATANAGGSSPSGGAAGEGGEGTATGGAVASGGMASGGIGSGGTSTAGAAGSTNGGSGGSASGGEVATLGDPCSTPGALACAGTHQKLTLLCGADGSWEANETCGNGQFCDSKSGPNAGICRDAIESCDNPEDTYCDGDELRKCGPDTVTSELVEVCGAGCLDAACLPGPGPDDEPCPESPALADCSTQCGADHADCAIAVCGKQGIIDLTGITLEPGMTLVRTPVASEATCDCEGLDPPPPEARFGFFMRTKLEAESILRISVPEPWFVRWTINHTVPELACTTEEGLGCAIVGHPQAESDETSTLYFWTPDSDAGSVNIEITEGDCE